MQIKKSTKCPVSVIKKCLYPSWPLIKSLSRCRGYRKFYDNYCESILGDPAGWNFHLEKLWKRSRTDWHHKVKGSRGTMLVHSWVVATPTGQFITTLWFMMTIQRFNSCNATLSIVIITCNRCQKRDFTLSVFRPTMPLRRATLGTGRSSFTSSDSAHHLP